MPVPMTMPMPNPMRSRDVRFLVRRPPPVAPCPSSSPPWAWMVSMLFLRRTLTATPSLVADAPTAMSVDVHRTAGAGASQQQGCRSAVQCAVYGTGSGSFASRRTRVANRSIDTSALTTSCAADLERHRVDRLAGHGRGVGHGREGVEIVRAQPDLGQRRRQADPRGELDEVADLARGRTFEHQLGDRADIDLLSVREPVRGGDRGEPVVDRVRRGQPTRLEPESGQQGVRLDDLLDRRGHLVVAHRVDRLERVVPQHVPAELGQRGAGQRRETAGHRGGVGPRGRPGLEPGGQCVPDTGDQQLHRRVRHDLGVDEHQVRVAREEAVLLELAVLGVDDRQGAARCVGRGDRGAVGPADAGQESGGLDRVDRATAADGDDDVGAGLLDDLDEPVDLLGARDAVERLAVRRQACRFSDASTSCPTSPQTRSSATRSGVDPIGLRYSPELVDRSLALHVTAGADDGSQRRCHRFSRCQRACYADPRQPQPPATAAGRLSLGRRHAGRAGDGAQPGRPPSGRPGRAR